MSRQQRRVDMKTQSPSSPEIIPSKLYFKIGEVSEIAGIRLPCPAVLGIGVPPIKPQTDLLRPAPVHPPRGGADPGDQVPPLPAQVHHRGRAPAPARRGRPHGPDSRQMLRQTAHRARKRLPGPPRLTAVTAPIPPEARPRSPRQPMCRAYRARRVSQAITGIA